MGALNLSAAELAALQSSPALLTQAINGLLGQARFLCTHYRVLTGKQIGADIPEAVTVPRDDTADTGITYGPNGLSAPRADGAVRSKAWDEAVEAALASHDPVVQAWGRGAAGPWIMIQDTLKLPDLTEIQRNHVLLNCSTCRFANGGTPRGKYAAFKASPLTSDRFGPRLADAEIKDAFSTSSDLAYPDGEVTWKGLWAKDLGKFAESSLAYFILTSGEAVRRELSK